MRLNSPQAVPWYFQLIVVFYALHTSMPVVGFYTPAVVNAAVVLYLYLYLFLRNNKETIADIKYILPIFSIYILSLLYEGASHLVTYIYGISQLFIYPLLALYLLKNGNQKFIRRVFLIIGLSYMITGITTYYGCQIFPSASRDIAAQLISEDPEQYAMYMSYNIGSFSFIYTLILTLPLLIYMIRDKRINMIIGLACIFIVVMTILASEYATALLFLIVCLMAFFLPKYFGQKEIVWIIVGTAVLYVAGKQFFGHAFESLANVVTSETVADRFHNLAVFFSGETDNVDGDVESRMDLYNLSIKAFFKSPLWGSSNAKVGGHSFMLDNLGRYGLLGLIAMIIMYRRMFKAFFKPCAQQKWYGYICLLFLVALAFAFLNPIDNPIVLTFIVPLFMASYKEELQA